MEDDSYLHNPLLENEFVGVDEEGMYLQIVPIDNVGKHVDDDGDEGGEGDGGGDEDGDGDGEDGDGEDGDGSEDMEVDEELAGYGKDHTPNVDYDKIDPPMAVGTIQRQGTTSKKKENCDRSASGHSRSPTLETTSTNKRKHANSDSGTSKRCRSRSGSNQPEPVSTEISLAGEQKAAPVKKNGKGKKKQIAKKILIYPMASPAMGTRSKRRLNL
ncbi:uncharacterized protein [Miscanthus floridulus]|uniref:uncharacterized protein n=1 Tax=Miscanthus floridulus TaxID=154761 RepID=UPI003458408E